MYTTDTVVRMGHVDPAGTIYFARVPELAYGAFEAFLDESDYCLGECWDELECGFPVVNCTTNYKIPIRLSDRLKISVQTERIGEKSFTLLFLLKDSKGLTRAEVRITQATVDRKTFKPIPIPPHFREGLAKLQPAPIEQP